MIKEKFTLIADGYKYFHNEMYPLEVEFITSTTYIRKPKMDLSFTNNKICVFGISLVLRRIENMLKDFVDTFSYNDLTEFDYMPESMKYNFSKLYMYLKEKEDSSSLLLDLLDIAYVQDGSFVNIGDRILVIKNKQKEFKWLPNYLETFINSELWKGTYVATQAASYLGAICSAYRNFGTTNYTEKMKWSYPAFRRVIHDFSARGMSGLYDTIFHNVAHLLFFDGTDSIAIDMLRTSGYYNDIKLNKLIPATEHSVMCSFGPAEEEYAITSLMTKYPDSPVSIVCDSYDIFKLLDKLRLDNDFKNALGLRDSSNPLIIRGDSGDPVKIMTGNNGFDKDNGSNRNRLEALGLVKSLEDLFMYEFKIGSIKAIYGDAITPTRTYEIFYNLLKDKIDPEHHIVLGAGSYTYNYATRDSVGMVTKATSYGYTSSDGKIVEEVEIVKDPATDPNKSSKKINKNMMLTLNEKDLNGSLKSFNKAKSVAENDFMIKIMPYINEIEKED